MKTIILELIVSIICIIFPKDSFKIEKFEYKISYPLKVFKKKKEIKEQKSLYVHLKQLLINKLKNWRNSSPWRKIEDFFKVAKEAFGLEKLHRYTTESTTKHIYFVILLTAIVIQEEYATKTAMQQLAEGIVGHKLLRK